MFLRDNSYRNASRQVETFFFTYTVQYLPLLRRREEHLHDGVELESVDLITRRTVVTVALVVPGTER